MKNFFRLPILTLVQLLWLWPQLLRADPLDQWHLRYGLPTPAHLIGVAYGNGMFVAVGGAGTILTSGDQVNWLPRKSGTTQPLRAISYANSLFVAVGGSTDSTTRSVVVTSPDGVNWTVRSAGTSQELHSVAYGNGTFVASGLKGNIVSSPDGNAWTRRSSQTSADLYGITYGNGAFVAVGGGGTFARSADGVSWTAGSAGTNRLFGIGFGAGNFVAVGGGSSILISSDGSQWRETPHKTDSWLLGVAFHENQFILVGDGETIIRLAEDFQCHAVSRSGKDDSLRSVAFGNGEFVAVGDTGLILRSRDGDKWTALDAPEPGEPMPIWITGVAYGNGRFVTVGEEGSLTSPNGTEWFRSYSSAGFDTITFANDVFVAFGQSDDTEAISLSRNGTQWDQRYLASSGGFRLNGVAYGNGRFVAVGEENPVSFALTSSDGINYTQTVLPVNDSGWRVAFGKGTFVTVGRGDSTFGSILSSNDGETWTVRRRNRSDGLTAITYGNGLFVAVGRTFASGTLSGIIFTSPDGIIWTRRGTPVVLLDVAYGGGFYVAVGGVGEAVTSTDGVTWTRRNTATGAALSTVTFGSGAFVAARNRAIVQSDPLADSPPMIVHGPDSMRVVPGADAALRVLATGTSPLSYQWLRNGVAIAGATNIALSLPNFQFSDSAIYSVAVGNRLGSVISQAAQLSVVSGDALDHWQWPNPLPQGDTVFLNSVVFGNSTFVAVGWPDTILTSTNGLYWARSETGAPGTLSMVTYGDGIFVAVGSDLNRDAGSDEGLILTSSDGIRWTRQSVCAADFLGAVAYGAHLFVAVGGSGTIITSPDGTNWTARASGRSSSLSGVTFGGELFVAVGGVALSTDIEQTILTSADGVQWTHREPSAPGGLFDVIFGNGVFMARVFNGGNNPSHVLTSRDGVNWSDSDLGFIGVLRDISFVNGLFTGFFELPNGGSAIYTSGDGANWVFQSPAPFQYPHDITYGNGRYLTVGDSGFISSSADLRNWSNYVGGPTGDLRDLAYGNGTYVAVGNATILRSTDGTVWTASTVAGAMYLSGIAYGNGLFAAVGAAADDSGIFHGTVLVSTDGAAWQKRSTNLPIYHAIVFANGSFVAVGDGGAIMSSRDGETWLTHDSPTTNSLSSVSFSNGKFVAVGASGTIVTSTNGTDWKLIPPFTGLPLGAIANNEWTFVVGGGGLWTDAFAYTSDDAENWDAHLLVPSGEEVLSMAYGDGQFVAVAHAWSSGAQLGVFSSSDGAHWHQRDLPVASGLNAIRYVNGSFWALGPNGTILQARSINRPRFRPETLRRLPDGTVSFVLDTDEGAQVVIEASPDLKTWTVLTTAPGQNGLVQFEDADAAKFPSRFYRASVVAP